MTDFERLAALGWRQFFQQQVTLDESTTTRPARVIAVQRGSITVAEAAGERQLPLTGRWYALPVEARPAVGDWLLLDPSGTTVVRVLERMSVFTRVRAGAKADLQVIAANVDTLFVVTSCNDEFNPSRLERYFALALEAGVEPVVVLTKADLTDDKERFVAEVRRLRRNVSVECVDARDADHLDALKAWCRPGQTIALVGSSGVGKSTLVNSLSGHQLQATGAIREDDAKGRHTTSHRSLHMLPDGGLLLDSPGMRELKISDAESGVAQTFDDVVTLAAGCRFADCSHEEEPGCAVRAAIAAGSFDERRLRNYKKLLREQARHSETIAEQRHRTRQFARRVRRVVAEKHKRP